ncbi:hypothetical protein B0H16DRAFT_1594531 [Mycena metata]|uniref:BTB domain-containing protein n=1 Tax=Mycena metata TaxID=1033252 RepID=A0AAD7HQW4_9AGAR|nr:hypothetical protein B0H16DRAFT_1594531 [Mycena metata]
MHSSVFRDMCQLALPADEPMVEGCPVVILPGDTAEDWTLFLGVLYPKAYSTELPTVRLVAAILRLSKKYDFPRFREDCVRRLKQEFPTTFAEFDKVRSKWTFFQDEVDTLLGILSLARDVDLHSIRPQLYCSIIEMYMHAILDPKNTSLIPSDRFACLMGAVSLMKLQFTTTLSWLDFKTKPPHIPSGTCTQHDKCSQGAKAIFLSIANPLPAYWIFDKWNQRWDPHLCRACRSKAKEIYDAGRETCWKELPAAFGLPDWEELKALDFE